MESKASFSKIKEQQDNLLKSLEANDVRHLTLERTVEKADNILSLLMFRLENFADFLGEDEIFDEQWEIEILEQVEQTYDQLIDMNNISDQKNIREFVEEGIMSAESGLVRDLYVIQDIINQEIKTHVLKSNQQGLESLKNEPSTPEQQLHILFLKIINVIMTEDYLALEIFKQEFENLKHQEGSFEYRELSLEIKEVLEEAEVAVDRQKALHVLQMNKEKLIFMIIHLKKLQLGENFEFPQFMSGLYEGAVSFLGRGIKKENWQTSKESQAELYNIPLPGLEIDNKGKVKEVGFNEFPSTKKLEEELKFITSLEGDIQSGKYSTIKEVLKKNPYGHVYERTTIPNFDKICSYLIDCENVAGRETTVVQNEELAQVYENKKKYFQKRNTLADNFMDAIFQDGVVAFPFESSGIILKSSLDLDKETERYLYSNYPKVINKTKEEARKFIDYEKIVNLLRDSILSLWKENDPNFDYQKKVDVKKLEQLLGSTVARVINAKIEQEAKAIVRDNMLKALVKHNEADIYSNLKTPSQKLAFEKYKESAFSSVSDFNLSDELSKTVHSEVFQMLLLVGVVKGLMHIPRNLTDKMIKPTVGKGGKLVRSKANLITYGTTSQVLDNLTTLVLFSGHISPGEWSIGLLTRVHYESWMKRVNTGRK